MSTPSDLALAREIHVLASTTTSPSRLRSVLFALVLVAFGASHGLSAQSLEGRWEGAVLTPQGELRMMLDFTADDPWTGTVDIPQQGASGLALEGIRFAGDSATFAIAGIPGEPTFRGVVAGDSLTGSFTQAGTVLTFAFARAGIAVEASIEALSEIGPWIEERLEDLRVPGVGVGVVKDGEVIHLEGYGLAELEGERPATASTLFAIGSSSKAFTAAAIGLLVDEGGVDWDDRVRAHIPEFALADSAVADRITIRDFLSHRSGLPRHDIVWYANPDESRAELLSRMAHLQPTADLRQRWQYNNFGFMVSGVVVERVSGLSWEDFVDERIFTPLGMERSNFDILALPEMGDHAKGYGLRDDELVLLPYRAIPAMGPAGSINSSAEEMVEWIKLQLALGEHGGERLLTSGTAQEMQNPQMVVGGKPATTLEGPMSYGLGWFVQPYRGHYRAQHGGNIDGFSALVELYPDDDLGIVVLSNRNGTPAPSIISERIADHVLGLEIVDAEEANDDDEDEGDDEDDDEDRDDEEGPEGPPSHGWESYAGTFEHPGYGEAEIRVQGEGLEMAYGIETFALKHRYFDVFEVDSPNSPFNGMRMRFLTSLEGSVSELEVGLEPTADPIVLTRAPDASTEDPAFLRRLTGTYRFETQTAEVDLRGTRLTVTLPGQPVYTLKPVEGMTFGSPQLPDSFRMRFEVPEDGPATSLTFLQPNGTFTFPRVEG